MTLKTFSKTWWLALSVAAFAVLHIQAAPPTGYYDGANGLSGNALRQALHNIIKNHTVLPYTSNTTTDTRAALKILDEDPNNSNNVLLHYKGTSVSKASFGTSWNREHLWPQSLGADVLPPNTDLHHIFAEDVIINSSRGNSVFDNVYPYHTNSAYGNYWTGTRFEVRDPQKGDVARALFYMDVRYNGTSGEPDLVLKNTVTPSYGEMGVLSTLLQWHQLDPPDAREQLRNDQVYALFQQNRNPFIDHPEYVYLIWGPVTDNDTVSVNFVNRAGATVSAGTANYPMLTIALAANSGEWDLGSLGLTNTGSLGDSYISAVRLYRDMDQSGSVTAGDILLANTTFSGGLATLTCADPSRVTTATVHFLVTADLVSTAPTGQTLQIQINANSLIHASSGGNDPDPTFSAFASNAATVSGGVSDGDTVSVSFTNRAPSTFAPGSTNVPFVSVHLAANTNEWDLSSFAVSKLGSLADSKVNAVKLYLDADNDGIADAGDTLLDSRTLAGSTSTFTLSQPYRITATGAHFLVTVDFSNVLTNGQTFGIQVNGNSFVSSVSGGVDVNPSVSNFSSSLATAAGGVSDGDTVSVSSTSLAPTTAPLGATSVALLKLILTASGNEWDVGTISVSRLGNASDAAVTNVSLYVDENTNDQVDAEDSLIDSRVLSGGAATFQVGGSVRVTDSPIALLIAADLAISSPSGRMLGIKVNANGITYSSSGGNDVNPTFSDQSSSLLAIINPALPPVKIAMVSTRGSDNAAAKEFIVLANHSSSSVNITGWQLRTRAGSSMGDGTPITLSGTIPAKSYFLLASNAYGTTCEGKTPDMSDSNSNGLFGGMADTTGRSIALFDGSGAAANKIDGFSFQGGATYDTNYYRDGSAFVGVGGSSTVSFARKTLAGELYYIDTENNANDLQNVSSKTPANSSMNLPVSLSRLMLE
ncbi:MAG: endonuclease [Candidatus Sumerlaeaceae bacterium]|nr:endonuclease [Candidatus Sumerlaeaceae bacterium]